MKQYNVRYQLKSDTETNWNKAGPKNGSNGFIPLNGELIIYQADKTHPFSRIKIGDGSTNVVNLPFIDAGTLNGLQVEIVKAETSDAFPATGSKDKLYIDLSNNKLYHYNTTLHEYSELLNFAIATTVSSAADITSWSAGLLTSATITGHKLTINNGTLPSLNYMRRQVVTSVTREGDE